VVTHGTMRTCSSPPAAKNSPTTAGSVRKSMVACSSATARSNSTVAHISAPPPSDHQGGAPARDGDDGNAETDPARMRASMDGRTPALCASDTSAVGALVSFPISLRSRFLVDLAMASVTK